MNVRVVVDRIEGDLAVLEVGGRTVDWPLAALPHGAREGDAFDVAFTAAPTALDDAKARLARLRAAAPPDDGDIDL